MDKAKLISQLRELADDLQPLTRSALSGSLIWNGTEYAKSEKSETPDPYALAWWLTLRTTASLLEAQTGAVDPKQIGFLKNLLFGGMGSLGDFYVDPKCARNAESINMKLSKKRSTLHVLFE